MGMTLAINLKPMTEPSRKIDSTFHRPYLRNSQGELSNGHTSRVFNQRLHPVIKRTVQFHQGGKGEKMMR